MSEKKGEVPYLGIIINYDKDKKLDKFSIDTLRDRYLWQEESSPQEAFARAAVYASTFQEETDYAMAQRIYNYASDLWFMFSTPILSNGGTTRGLPISCFLNYVGDSIDELTDHFKENARLASSGGGIGGYWGDVRSDGTSTSNGSKSTGSIPFMKVVDSEMLAFNQGVTRRGSYAAYTDISHPEIEEFMVMRKESGGDVNRKCLNLHNGVNINNAFLRAVETDDDWRLIDPKTKEPTKIVNARDLWWQIIHARAETGEPYMINIDTCNKHLPKEQKDLGLKIKQSNLCSEITLPTDEERTAVCCLCSVNLEHFDKWSKDEKFISDLITMLDNVIEHYIENAIDTSQLGGYSANFKRFQNYVREGKKVILNLPIRHIEREVSAWVQWVFMHIYNLGTYLLKVFSQLDLTTKLLYILNQEQLKQLKSWLSKGAKLLTSTVQVGEMLISWLLLLMLVVGLYVVGLLLVLSLIELIAILIKLCQEVTKLRINILKRFSNQKD